MLFVSISKLWAEGLATNKAYIILFLIIAAAALFTYTYKIVGIAPAYDDSVYAYSLLNPLSLKTTSLFGGSIGFFIYGYLFIHLLGHIMIVPTLMTLSAIVLTMLFIFLIGNEYKNMFIGVLASVLYAFNPVVFAYSNRLLPDIFTTMLLAFSILIFLKARKSNKGYLFLSSGLIVAIGIFFGYQAAFAVLIYVVFVISSMILEKKRVKALDFIFIFAGMLLAIIFWMAYQQYLYGTPFFLFTGAAKIYAITSTYAWSSSYYPALLLPMHVIPNTLEGSWEPHVNVGLLGFAFLFSSMFLFTKYGRKYRKQVLPYSVSSLAFVLFLMYGSQSLTVYSPLYDENRFLMPFVLMASLGVAIAISSLKKRPAIIVSTAFVILYVAFLAAAAPNTLSFYGSQDAFFTYLQSAAPYQNMSTYTVYQNIFSISDAFCYLLNASHQNCQDNTLVPVPAGICMQNKTAIFSTEEICNQSTAFGYPLVYIHVRN